MATAIGFSHTTICRIWTAKAGCPVSKLLNAKITLDATLL
jgi:hypothetical protein